MAERIGANYSIGQSILGRWRIRETAGGYGKSGMGIVYIADDLQDHRTVAIKTFQPEFVAEARIKRLLLREANVWLEMGQHENIVSVEHVEVIGSQPLIFMEYVAPDSQGRNCLTDHLAHGAQPFELTLAWAQQICAALTHMRACGIDVHRDLKPDNIMISGAGTVKVTDFGLARAFDGWTTTLSSAGGQRLPGATGIVGTPGYIAPEIIIGHRADVRSDVYCFGLVLAQMITGQRRPPLTADGFSDVLSFEQANLEIRRQTAPPTTRSQLHGVVSRCLQFDPVNRYAHFPAVADAIRLACAPLDTHADRRSVASVENESIANQALLHVDSLRKLGRYDEALANILQLRRDSDFSPALLDAEGLIRADIGDFDRAIELHEAACEVDAENPGFRNNLGRAYRAASQFEAAREQIAMALELGDRSAGTWSNLAICELDLKHYNRALIGFDHALALDPHFVIALLGRAEALYRLGRIGEALQPLTRALEMEPDHPGALKLLKILQAALR
jgi:serine/threonine protein kinase